MLNCNRWLTCASIAVCLQAHGFKLSPQEVELVETVFAEHQAAQVTKSNRYAGNVQAVALGEALFHSKKLSADGDVACSTCHKPENDWTDSLTMPENGNRNVPTLWNVAKLRWFFWDGRADSLWNQAMQVLENKAEHNISRTAVVQLALTDDEFKVSFKELVNGEPPTPALLKANACASPVSTQANCRQAWNSLPSDIRKEINSLFVLSAKIIAAFVETINAPESRFDRFRQQVADEGVSRELNERELAGFRIFIGDGNCIACHFGPDLTDGEFHDVRVRPSIGAVEPGRQDGARQLLEDPFNLLSDYNDAPGAVEHTRYLRVRDEDWAKYKTPTLRRVAHTAPYMHQGQFATLTDVVMHYSLFAEALPAGHHGELFLKPMFLTVDEIQALVAFLETL